MPSSSCRCRTPLTYDDHQLFFIKLEVKSNVSKSSCVGIDTSLKNRNFQRSYLVHLVYRVDGRKCEWAQSTRHVIRRFCCALSSSHTHTHACCGQ